MIAIAPASAVISAPAPMEEYIAPASVVFVREFISNVSDACEKFQLIQAASQAHSLITETARTFARALASV